MIKMKDLNLNKKRVFIRVDFNVPVQNKSITSYERINRSIPTIQLALKKNAKIIIASHFGRPLNYKYEEKLSLYPIYKYLKKIFPKQNIRFITNYLDGFEIKSGEIVLLENVRFNYGEKENNIELSKKYAKLCDIFVMDAFATAHRMESSTYGICKFVKIACAGPLLSLEIKTLKTILKNPKRPMISIIGGAKVSTKFNVLKKILKITDIMIVGGGIANTFISVFHSIGNSLYEKNFKKEAEDLYTSKKIILPIDSRVGTSYSISSLATNKLISEISDKEEIMDIGDKSIENYITLIKNARTILWNGPLGVFEFPNFRKGTEKISKAIAESTAFSVAGGGDTIAVIDLFKLKNKISYISTGGGSFLEFIEKKTLPILKLLDQFSIKK